MIKHFNHNGTEYAVRNTQRVRDAYARYENSDYYYLYHVYSTWSDEKEAVFNKWNKKINGLKIISFNQMMFTLGGYITIDNVKYFVYITPSKKEALKIEVLE